jgi:hypothetical protein
MNNLSTYLQVGTKIGLRSPTYTVEKVTRELIYLRSEASSKNPNGTLRLIPSIVISDLLRAIRENRITPEEIIRKRDNNESEKLFQKLNLDHDPFILGYEATIKAICEHCLNQPQNTIAPPTLTHLTKPFLLLAGISGTGKTRFVRQQAERSAMAGTSNFELIPVRPDWHEPSDLLGYVSRIDGTRYVATPFLQFMAAAWRDAAEPSAAYQLKDPADMTTFWACLDEMNLAPVEQYFADYLSVLETREWRDDHYSSEPIFAPNKLLKSADDDVLNQLRSDLGFAGDDWAGLWSYFLEHGMPLPPNLIVAGTVNMDETTHGFSRKVIDRAFTIDFGEFFPNVYDDFFAPKLEPVTLGFALDSQIANADELGDVAADPNGQRSIEFLKAVNELLKGTPFELAFRALNELLVMLKCFSPQTSEQLYAVWDDFLMAKLLPRLEGDEDKLQANGDDSLLIKLKTLLGTQFESISSRPDLFNLDSKGIAPSIQFRSLKKLGWMQDRLVRDRFTSFWP